MLLMADEAQLILIDYQTRLMPAVADGPAVLANAVRLARLAQEFRLPVWTTEQVPAKLGETCADLRPLAGRVISKTRFSAAEELEPHLQPPRQAPQGNARSLPRHLQKPAAPEPKRSQLVLAGCEAHVCLLQTALELLDRDWDVYVVTDACGSRTERNRDAAFDRLAGAGAELVTTEMVAFEWLESAAHPAFKVVSALVK